MRSINRLGLNSTSQFLLLLKSSKQTGLFGDSKWLASRENYSKLFKVLKPAWGKEADWGNDALKVYSESSKKLPERESKAKHLSP